MIFAHVFTFLVALFVGIQHHTFLSHKIAIRSNTSHNAVLGSSIKSIYPTISVIPTPTTNIVPTPSPVLIDCIGPDGKHLLVTQQKCTDFTHAWHKDSPSLPATVKQIAPHTYTMKFIPDVRMASPQELFTALNIYRQNNGVSQLTWNTTLASFAQSRANFFEQRGSLDEHNGFIQFVHNNNGFTKLGFTNLGENAAYAGPLLGEHLITWIYAGDPEHNQNQLNPMWTNVGVGINGVASDIIFGTN